MTYGSGIGQASTAMASTTYCSSNHAYSESPTSRKRVYTAGLCLELLLSLTSTYILATVGREFDGTGYNHEPGLCEQRRHGEALTYR